MESMEKREKIDKKLLIMTFAYPFILFHGKQEAKALML
jgi:hypothetical protein